MATLLSEQNNLKRAKVIWQIVLVLFITVSIPLTILVLKYSADLRSKASPTEEPREVVISNISDQGVTVSFHTPETDTLSTIKYGLAEGEELDSTSFDSRYDDNAENLYRIHHHQLARLKEETEYKFTITVGEKTYTSDDFKFKTFKSTSGVSTPLPINGRVDGDDFKEGVVYAHLKDNETISTVISAMLPKSGAYTLDLGAAKKENGDKFNVSGSELYVFANAGTDGKGSIKTTSTTETLEMISLAPSDQEYDPLTLEDGIGDAPTPTSEPPDDPEPDVTEEPEPNDPTPTDIPEPDITDEPEPDPEPSDGLNTDLLTSYYDSPESETDPSAPSRILISNLDSKTFTVNWLTKTPTTGSVVYGVEKEPDKKTLDKRDTSIDDQTARYSHSVDIVDSDLNAEGIVEFRLLVSGKEYGDQAGNFKIQTPATPPSPPSPDSQGGTLDPTFTDPEEEDFMILAKASNESTWISTISSEASTWLLPYGVLRKSDGSAYLGAPDSLQVEIYGDNNSSSTQTLTVSEDQPAVEVKRGITATLQSEATLKSGEVIQGQTEAGESITVLVGEETEVVKSNSQGNWSYTVPPNAPEGDQVIKFSNDRMTLPYKVRLERTLATPTPRPTRTPATTTPDTAIEDYFFLMPGILILLIGFSLIPLGAKRPEDQIEFISSSPDSQEDN